MAAYYNEIDPYAAQWLRNLIKSRHIANGIVDERDIRDVTPNDLKNTTPFGQDLAPVSLSARLAKEKGLMTSGTFSHRGIGSSQSADLQMFLVNKLPAKLAWAGSTLYRLTWKERVTPLGRSIYALRAWAHRTCVKDCGLQATGWGTPLASDPIGGVKKDILNTNSQIKLRDQVHLASWPTPLASNGSKDCNRYRPNNQNGLGAIASLAVWPTPTTRDHKGDIKVAE